MTETEGQDGSSQATAPCSPKPGSHAALCRLNEWGCATAAGTQQTPSAYHFARLLLQVFFPRYTHHQTALSQPPCMKGGSPCRKGRTN